ncbi:MAG: hypothetical protein K2J40_11575 [Ruminococcus sp.]|nr:hypothetical protein [Ruminococcus sp.]
MPDPYEKEEEICSGYVELHNKNLHFERIKGCELMKKSDSVSDVLVIWYSYNKEGEWFVVGWYNHAIVYRNPSKSPTNEYFIAKAENCVLLPKDVRTEQEWKKPDFLILEQSYIKYANTPELEKYSEEISNRINSYDGENWLNRYPPLKKRKIKILRGKRRK